MNREELRGWLGISCLDQVNPDVPESIVLCCQKLIRCALQTMVKTLTVNTSNFEIVEEMGCGFQTVSSNDKDYIVFAAALNNMIKNYSALRQGSISLLDSAIERERIKVASEERVRI